MAEKYREQPITLPANPYWEVLKTFGRDEFYAIILSMLATGGVMGLLHFWPAPAIVGAAMLALAGPIFEKFGFFIGHIKDAREVYSTTPAVDRQAFSYYAKRAFRGGFKSLVWDILVHDPIYIALMFGGLYFNPETPAWLLVPVAFGVAVLVVTVADVSLVELRYWLLGKKLKGFGFRRVKYLESRFVVEEDKNPEAFLGKLMSIARGSTSLLIPYIRAVDYTDSYQKVCLPNYNGRVPVVRFRKKTENNVIDSSLQLVFTKAEETKQALDQYRFFPQKKDKYHLKTRATCLADINDKELLRLFRGMTLQDEPIQTVSFKRWIISDKDYMYIAIDKLESGASLIELKVFADKAHLLRTVMRYIMHHYKVLQTTHNKISIAELVPDPALPAA